ncbi:hypothetical protein PybrP1_006092 [[Pythium] brassicae (nom. inval.)]|nr:hypothetical protein PybrP1_006092 [[Pythium] brassicae (nom. inval.)]
MAARPRAPTKTTASTEIASAVHPPSRLDLLRRHRSQRDVKKTVAAPLPSFSYAEDRKASAALAASPTSAATTSSGPSVKSRSRASRASDALSKLSAHFFKPRRASDSTDSPDAVTAPATSEERRFWPRRLASEKKVTPALQSTTPDDPSQERRNSVEAAGSGKSDTVRDPTTTTVAGAKADSKSGPGTSSKSRVAPSHDAVPHRSSQPNPDALATSSAAAHELPFTPQYVYQAFASELTELEESEMLEYGEIYFFSAASIKSRRRGGKIHATPSSTTDAAAQPGAASEGAGANPCTPTQAASASERTSSFSPPPLAELFNDGYDDERGDYLVLIQDHLAFRYEVLHTLGAGSFGQVVCCLDHQTQQRVAVKIIRNRKRYREQSLIEVQILAQLQRSVAAPGADGVGPGPAHIVKMREYFLFRGHLCIVFDLLGINLARVEEVCLIDFGSSCLETAAHFFNDSAAVPAAAAATTDASSDTAVASAGARASSKASSRSAGPATAATAALAFHAKPFVNSRGRKRLPGSRSLASAVRSDDRQFLDFVRRCLALDPRERMTPEQAARDPWLFSPALAADARGQDDDSSQSGSRSAA